LLKGKGDKKKSGGDTERQQKGPVVAVDRPNAPVTAHDHLEKKMEGLRRKIRDIDVLQVNHILYIKYVVQKKIADGQLANPEKSQLEKIDRRSAIEEEIIDLERQLERL
jgi:hypothetical protein